MSGSALRPRPDDFWSTYVDIGKPGCEAYYRAHWKTVDRWVDEVGKAELRAARADEVRRRREEKKQKAAIGRRDPVVDDSPPDPDDLKAACHYLRGPTTYVGVNERGEYFVNSKIMLPSEIVAMALAQGMDEWYVECDIYSRIASEEGIDFWLIEKE